MVKKIKTYRYTITDNNRLIPRSTERAVCPLLINSSGLLLKLCFDDVV